MANNIDPASPFTHTPLEDAKKQIRLIQIQAQGDQGKLHLKLATFSIEKTPQYAAISYVWGPPEPSRQIWVNDGSFTVRDNSHYALTQAAQCQRPIYGIPFLPAKPWTYFWMDAICIDQTNDDEKSQQVAMMWDIYQRAGIVLSSVGRHDKVGQSKVLYDMICLPWYLSFLERLNPASDFQWFIMRSILSVFCTYRLQHMDQHMSRKGSAKRFVDEIMTYGLTEYWHRLWISQELFQPRRVMLMKGGDMLWAAMMSCWLRAAHVLTVKNPSEDEEWRNVAMNDLLPHQDSAMAKLIGNKRPLDSAMSVFHHRECFDARDRVYGVRNMISWPDGCEPIMPDYKNKTRYQLALDILDIYAKYNEPSRNLPLDLAEDIYRAMRLEPGDSDMLNLARQRSQDPSNHRTLDEKGGRVDESRSAELPKPGMPQIKDYHLSHAIALQASDGHNLLFPEDLFSLPSFYRELDYQPSSGNDLPSYSVKPKELKILHIKGQQVGVACAATSPGDLLVPLRRDNENIRERVMWLILRYHRSQQQYELLGHAFLIGSVVAWNARLLDRCGEDCNLKHELFPSEVKVVRLHLSCEDLLLLASQYRQYRWRVDIDDPDDLEEVRPDWERLEMRVTKEEDRFSSFAVEVGEAEELHGSSSRYIQESVQYSSLEGEEQA